MEALASHLAPQAIRVPCTLSSVLLEGKLGSAFFHTSWGADNSQSADLGSAPPEISLRCCLKMYRLKKFSFGAQKRVPAGLWTWTEEYSQETSQLEAGELSPGVVLAGMELSQ